MTTRSVLKWGIVCTLMAGALYYWYIVRPRMIASDMLNRYETACYARDLHAVDKLLYRRIHDKTSQKKARSVFDQFEKFEPGFELLSAKRVDWEVGTQMIEVELSKVAKVDHERQPFFNIRLINADGDWKVFQYYFPGVTEY